MEKRFTAKHLIFDNIPDKSFSETNPPTWLLNAEYNWWYEKYVLTLLRGHSIKSDFWEITRTR